MEQDKKIGEMVTIALQNGDDQLLFKLSNLLEKRAQFEANLKEFVSSISKI